MHYCPHCKMRLSAAQAMAKRCTICGEALTISIGERSNSPAALKLSQPAFRIPDFRTSTPTTGSCATAHQTDKQQTSAKASAAAKAKVDAPWDLCIFLSAIVFGAAGFAVHHFGGEILVRNSLWCLAAAMGSGWWNACVPPDPGFRGTRGTTLLALLLGKAGVIGLALGMWYLVF